MHLRAFALVAVASLVSFHATPAGAGPPDPSMSTVPLYVRVVGAQTSAGVPDPNAPFTVTVRDDLGALLSGVDVVLDLTGCVDTHLCTAVVAGQTLDCIGRTVTATTGINGEVTFQVMGASDDVGTSTTSPIPFAGAGAGCMQVYAMPGSILLGTVTAVVFDINGSLPGGNGMNGLDIAIAKNTVGDYNLCITAMYPWTTCFRGRCDYFNDQDLNGLDLAFMKDFVGFSGLGVGSGAGCASGGPQPYCP